MANKRSLPLIAHKVRVRGYERPATVSIQPVIDEALKMSPRKAEALVEQEKREMGVQSSNNCLGFALGVGLFCVILLAGLAVAL